MPGEGLAFSGAVGRLSRGLPGRRALGSGAYPGPPPASPAPAAGRAVGSSPALPGAVRGGAARPLIVCRQPRCSPFLINPPLRVIYRNGWRPGLARGRRAALAMCSACTALGPDPAPSCSCAGFIKEALHFQACSLLPSGVVSSGAFSVVFWFFWGFFWHCGVIFIHRPPSSSSSPSPFEHLPPEFNDVKLFWANVRWDFVR